MIEHATLRDLIWSHKSDIKRTNLSEIMIACR